MKDLFVYAFDAFGLFLIGALIMDRIQAALFILERRRRRRS